MGRNGRSNVSRLTQEDFYKVCRWIDEHRDSLERDRPRILQIAHSATKATGVELSDWNVRSCLKTLGLNLYREEKLKIPAAEAGGNTEVLLEQLAALERKVAKLETLRVRMDQIEGRIDRLEEAMSRRSPHLLNGPVAAGPKDE